MEVDAGMTSIQTGGGRRWDGQRMELQVRVDTRELQFQLSYTIKIYKYITECEESNQDRNEMINCLMFVSRLESWP